MRKLMQSTFRMNKSNKNENENEEEHRGGYIRPYLLNKARKRYDDAASALSVINAHDSTEKDESKKDGGTVALVDYAPWSLLYKSLSRNEIERIVTRFYERVFAVDDWFRAAFANLSPMERHIWAQTMMWQDSFGYGHQYHGGSYRLGFHHNRVKVVMTTRGAVRWLHYMRETLNEVEREWCDGDAHKAALVRLAIDDFIRLTMGMYDEQFKELDMNEAFSVKDGEAYEKALPPFELPDDDSDDFLY